MPLCQSYRQPTHIGGKLGFPSVLRGYVHRPFVVIIVVFTIFSLTPRMIAEGCIETKKTFPLKTTRLLQLKDPAIVNPHTPIYLPQKYLTLCVSTPNGQTHPVFFSNGLGGGDGGKH